MSRPVPYAKVEQWLWELPRWKARLELMREQLLRIPGLTQKFELVAIHGQGQKNEAILHQVIRKMQLQDIEIPWMELRIEVLEAVIRSLDPAYRQYVKDRYILRLPALTVMEKLGITHRTYYRRRKQALEQVYQFAGGRNSILDVPDMEFAHAEESYPPGQE